MKCRVCGGHMRSVETDLPFKLSDHSIVVIKELPVLLCENCAEYAIEDQIMAAVDHILDGSDNSAELRVVKYAA